MKVTNYGPSGLNPYKRELQKADEMKVKTRKVKDQLEISQEAIELQKRMDPLRQEKISELKAKIESGTYTVDHQQLARKMYDYFKNKNGAE